MNLIDKQNELLLKLHDTNYSVFGGNKEDALSFICDQLTSFPNYANVVIREQIMIPIWQRSCDGDEYRENVQRIDSERRMAHNRAISGMSILNRINDKLGLEPFFNVDTEDRYAVADAVGRYVCEIYDNNDGKSFDDAVMHKNCEYDPAIVNEKLNNEIARLSSRFCASINELNVSETHDDSTPTPK